MKVLRTKIIELFIKIVRLGKKMTFTLTLSIMRDQEFFLIVSHISYKNTHMVIKTILTIVFF